MANRYSNNRRQAQRDNSGRRNYVPPEAAAAPIKMRGPRKSKFNIILILVVLVLAYFGLSPLLTSKPQGEQPVVKNSNGELEVASFPIISEVMSANRNALAAEDGEFYDWIEIYNPTENNINLSGFALSDDIEEPAKYVLPSKVLGPGEFMVVFASGGAVESPVHANFGISSSGETLFLADPHANIKDTVNVVHLSPNCSYKRNLTTLQDWEETELFSPGFFNDQGGYDEFLATRRVYDSPLKINEVMSSNLITLADEDGDYSDWVELTNVGTEPLDLSGYALSDDEKAARDWVFPDGIVLNPGQYLVVFLSGKDKVGETGELHTSFKLNSMKDNILCANIQGQVLDIWAVIEPGDDVSMGIDPDTKQAVYLNHPTPGYENTEDGYNEFQKSQLQNNTTGLILSEIMMGNETTLKDNFDLYPDWIELYNNTDTRLDLGGYGLSDNSAQLGKWKFPTGSSIEPGSYKIVYASGMGTETDTATNYLHTNFSLGIAGEPVILTDPDGQVVDKCVLSSMPTGISYGRSTTDSVFQYMLSPSPGDVNGDGYSGFAPTPYIPLEGGVYADPQVIGINVPEGCTVRYTTDSSNPTERSKLYEGPFQINETTVIKARAFKSSKLDSMVTTQTYFINVEHKIPVVSITADPVYLYSERKGILEYGNDYSRKYPFKGANFHQDWEVPAHVEMYEIDGSRVLNQGIGLRVFGAYSRAEIAKNFTLVARSKYGKETFDYPIFPDRPFTEYKSVILRNGASEWYASKILDSTLTSLVRDTTDLDVQAYYPVAYYLNGKYYGCYFFREKLNKYYLAQHRGINPDNVDIIYGNGNNSSNAVTGDNKNWLELKNFVENNNLSIQTNYDKVDKWVDIDNFMDMVINEIYVGNTDTGNIKCYREKKDDAKWRWFYYDVDWSFSDPNKPNSLEEYLNPEGHGSGDRFDTWLILGLMNNEGFKQKFLERFAYHIAVTYAPDRVLERIDHIVEQIDHEMVADREVWNDRFYNETPDWYKQALGSAHARAMSYKSWSTRQVPKRKTFAQKRPEVMKKFLENYFNLSDEESKELFGD